MGNKIKQTMAFSCGRKKTVGSSIQVKMDVSVRQLSDGDGYIFILVPNKTDSHDSHGGISGNFLIDTFPSNICSNKCFHNTQNCCRPSNQKCGLWMLWIALQSKYVKHSITKKIRTHTQQDDIFGYLWFGSLIKVAHKSDRNECHSEDPLIKIKWCA